MKIKNPLYGLFLAVLAFGCAAQPPNVGENTTGENAEISQAEVPAATETAAGENFARVTAVEVTDREPSRYSFSVTIESPDTGCQQYANWWEVASEEGELLYRRTLAHSHVDEQPFKRSGGPIEIAPEEVVIVRSHMHPTGYSTQAMKGSVEGGFETVVLPEDFATELAEAEPLPSGCTF